MNRIALVLVFAFPLAALCQQPSRQAVVRVQKTSLSRAQEIEIGQQFSKQVEREMDVIHNAKIEAWLNQIGDKLARTPEANNYPYHFQLVNDNSINAFALPGGPMFVNTGLLKAADNEAEVAGVLAHEMSHVALRHGAAQISKQQTWGSLFQIIGVAAGTLTLDQSGQCSMLCQLTQTGTALGANSVLMKFSRDYERDADLNGARMMAAAGYDPMQLPLFFQKLQKSMGAKTEPRGLALWLADHPATSSRIRYVSQDIRFYPKRDYDAGTGEFPEIKKLVATLPPPRPQPGMLILAKENATPRPNLPQGFKDYVANGFSVAYPDSWGVGQPQPGSSLYIVPQGGLVKGQNNSEELIAGAMIDYYVPKAGTSTVNLEASTREFIDAMRQGDANLKADSPQRAQVGGKAALKTRLTTRTSLQQDPDQVVYLYTVPRESGLWFLVLASPHSLLSNFDPIASQMVGTVQFPN